MDHEEFRQRLEAARVRAAMQQLEAVETLAKNPDLSPANGETFPRQRARRLRDDPQVGVKRDPIKPTDTER
jgi:hypothetical protein